jgi:hypothetical protein
MRIFVQLGRYGDILNILPALHSHHVVTGEKPGLVVSREFAGIFSGITYATPHLYPGHFTHPEAAAAWIRQHLRQATVLNTQVYSAVGYIQPKGSSFLIDSWSRARSGVPWGRFKLVLDGVDMKKAARLCPDTEKPLILVAGGGYSAPFDVSGLISQLQQRLPGFSLVDMSTIRAENFVDLVGPMSKAHAIVSSDTGTLHLANAVDVPVFALQAEKPNTWCSSAWRPNWSGSLRYSEVSSKIGYMAEILSGARSQPRIVHVFSDFLPQEPETRRRFELAQSTWREERNWAGIWRLCPVRDGDLPRHSGRLGDPRPMPFIRDLMDIGVAKSGEKDIVVFTNSDICLTPGLTGWLLEAVRRHGSAFCYRRDFSILRAPKLSEIDVAEGRHYPGSDLFVFTPKWWRENREKIPDMILGREYWDSVFRQQIKLTGGVPIREGIYHEWHHSFWEQPGNRHSNVGNIVNKKVASEFFARNNTSFLD